MGFLTKSEVSERNMIYKLEYPTEWQMRRFIQLISKLCGVDTPSYPAMEFTIREIFEATKKYYENEILGNTAKELR